MLGVMLGRPDVAATGLRCLGLLMAFELVGVFFAGGGADFLGVEGGGGLLFFALAGGAAACPLAINMLEVWVRNPEDSEVPLSELSSSCGS